ncbi:glucose/arabinose dehydrogenase/PKD repeat protein [Streptosporangium lutulentum]|uniref:Glucose/arabinose dehydrogenase/PKD repeat protein n=2 Tax=Streptosporangium lutulentum TaxID=1461250 RepID=A0ABT9Q234_9ACTN|nr:PQQ-dependent sugar dehydrogenase [Streptosporangium lutulentum]MDP9840794.1 glucose/arabinose dehydrogenase/PKD repeat protein [Streptosporangium lutulentum]
MRFPLFRSLVIPAAPGRKRPLVVTPFGAAFVAMLLALAAILHPIPASAAPPVDPTKFQQVTLAKGVAEVGEPMSMAVLPDRSVLHTARDGTVRITDAAGNTKVSGKLSVYFNDEEGMQGVGVDPGFASNRFVYLYYAPPLSTPPNNAPLDGTAADFARFDGVNRLSRFRLNTDGTLDLASEKAVLDVKTSRGFCCHVGGDIDFDAAGNLYLTTGDDSEPGFNDGYAPLDDRATRNPALDAQRGAANTNDLRGKVLRIKVNADGSYSIPAGNMFPPGTANTRPEIYAMGFRNPFRMSVDKATGVVYLGDYGPDAGTAGPRGPGGQVEFDRITGPGFYGWPYCTGNNTPAETYARYNYATGAIGAKYDCAGGPENTSRNNTGQVKLPPAKPAWITYDGCNLPEFGCGAESPMGGVVYRYDAALNSPIKFPQALDGHFLAGELQRQWIKDIEVNADGGRGTIQPFPWSGKLVMDMAFGPDGALYVLDYGTGWFNGNQDSALYRIEAVGTGGRAPLAKASADRVSGKAPLTVAFSSAGSSDPDGDALTYSWAFGDGGTSTAANPTHVYTTDGRRTVTLTVRDGTGLTATANVEINVGNTAPTVSIQLPLNGQVFSFGDTVPYRITVTDPEDTVIDCSRVKLTYILGHDTHGHPLATATGCSGTIQTPANGDHDGAANLFGVWDAEYTDAGALTTHAQHVTQPKNRQAEHYTTSQGVVQYDKPTAHGAKTVGSIENGDWIAFDPYVLAGASRITARVSSGGVGGTIQVRAGSPTGTLLGTATVAPTGGWETFTDVGATLAGAPAGTTRLYLVFAGGTGPLFDVDDFTLTVGSGPPPTGGLLSAGRPTAASSTENAGFPSSAVVDGNAGTRWSSGFADPQWISVDLGSVKSVNRVRLQWEAAYGRAYRIETSTDNTTWSSVSSTTAGDGGVDDITIPAVNARYVRVYGTQRATPYGYSLWELEVYGA